MTESYSVVTKKWRTTELENRCHDCSRSSVAGKSLELKEEHHKESEEQTELPASGDTALCASWRIGQEWQSSTREAAWFK